MVRTPSSAPETQTGEDGPKPTSDSGAQGPGKKQFVTGAAVGIGSAALVAALLYANRSKKNGKGDAA